jgi:hypothetical protein
LRALRELKRLQQPQSAFVLCSSRALGLGSPLVTPKPPGRQPLPGARNESRAFLESLRGRALCIRV